MMLRTKTYSTTDPSVTQRELDNRAIARRAAAEGMVLLKNEGGLLPLAPGKKLALYGAGAEYTFKGGTGSGDVNEREQVNILQGLENAGFQITTRQWLAEYNAAYTQARLAWRDRLLALAAQQEMRNFFFIYSSNPFVVPDGRPVSEDDVAQSDTDTAVYIISRIAGEGADRSAQAGDYYLTQGQMADLRFLCAHYAHVILIINTGAQVDLAFLEELPAIQSVIYMVQAGMEGGNALADLLTGKVTPSGKLTDTWARAYSDYPASASFSHNNGNVDQELYEEGIYVGYRWFDSFGISPQFPFGYGLSYTSFSLADPAVSVDEAAQTVTVSLWVTNTGSTYSGKEVVQFYAACPQAGLPKELKRLCGFAKTGLLAPGERQQVTVTFPVKALASFDEGGNAWVAQSGLYGIFAGTSARDVSLVAALEVKRDSLVEQVTPICPLRQPLAEKVRPQAVAEAFEASWHNECKAKKLPIIPLAVRPMDKARRSPSEPLKRAREVVETLSDDQLVHMVVGEISRGQGSASAIGAAGIAVPGAAGETSSILEQSHHIPGLPMADGPAGLRLKREYRVSRETGQLLPTAPFAAFAGGLFGSNEDTPDGEPHYQFCTAFPVGTLLAQSWDEALLYEVGAAVGRELEEYGVTWWLAPGMNLHRDPLCGRNFEYFSEDPVVSGKMAAAITRGVQSLPGIGTTIKHFACNSCEDNRMGSDSVLSQRTLRELYLRGFEIAVRESQPMAIMTSYNLVNGVHAANSYDLCTVAARQEWDFQGIIMTDWTTTGARGGSTPWMCAAAGNDLIMPGAQRDLEDIAEALRSGTLDRAALKECVARLISIAYQSNCYEDAVSYSQQFFPA